MEAARTSETSVDNYFTRQYIPEDNSELHTRRRENFKCHWNLISAIYLEGIRKSRKLHLGYCDRLYFWTLPIVIIIKYNVWKDGFCFRHKVLSPDLERGLPEYPTNRFYFLVCFFLITKRLHLSKRFHFVFYNWGDAQIQKVQSNAK
jgi:hypothetical protein